MSHGRATAAAGVARRVDSLSLLSDPQSYVVAGPVGQSSVPAGTQIIDEYPTFPADTIPQGTKQCVTGTTACFCTYNTTTPKYLRGATDTFTVRAGTSTILQMAAAMAYKSGDLASNCKNVADKAVNIIRRSTDCGVSWTTSVLNAGGFEGKFFSNADLPFIYVDRNNTNRIFVYGGSGAPLGGVSGEVVWRSDDNGQTWTPKFSPKDSAGNSILTSSAAMTTTSTGTLVLAACGLDLSATYSTPLYVYFSKDNGDTWSGPITQPAAVPNCGWIPANPTTQITSYMPGHLNRGPGMSVSVSRVAPISGQNVTGVRIAYTAREADSTGVATSQRQFLKIALATVPNATSSGTTGTLSSLNNIRPTGLDDSIFRGTYIETDAFGPTVESDAAMLWWLEGRRSSGTDNDTYTAKYLFHYMTSNYTTTYPLSMNLFGNEIRWKYNYCTGTPSSCWVGEYDQGAYWYDASTNRSHYTPKWPATDVSFGSPNTFHYFNDIQVTP